MKKPAFPISPKGSKCLPIHATCPGSLDELKTRLTPAHMAWLQACRFKGADGEICLLPGSEGELSGVVFGHEEATNPFAFGKLASSLPPGDYALQGKSKRLQQETLGFALGAYRFDRYTKKDKPGASLALSGKVDRDKLEREAEATFLVRDLINTPTNDMGPDQLESALRQLAARFKAQLTVTKGNDLLKKNFPMIHAVGRASKHAPRLLDMKWGNQKHPRLTLVGKGVCFDTGGLNIKPGSSMALMKKDMGGAANVIGLAMMVMAAKLPVRLRVLIPAVENSISGDAFRPGDILSSRLGLSVEIANTDAEGRLVLGDALALGDEENPDLMIDMATLTGAARVALGPDLPPFYTDDEGLADALSQSANDENDPLWRMPLWKPYVSMLASKIADTNHVTSGGFAGSITAALFLQKFVRPQTPWIHLDVFGWVPTAKPWAPVGGEAQGIRALFSVFEKRYAKS